jgi:hypothetical protein
VERAQTLERVRARALELGVGGDDLDDVRTLAQRVYVVFFDLCHPTS